MPSKSNQLKDLSPLTEPSDYRFPKQLRLRLKTDFDRVFKTGEVAADATLVVHACRNDLGYTRLGLSVSKRVGSAPVRNRWKRWMREAFRLNRHRLPNNLDLILRPKRDAIGSFAAIELSLLKLVKKVERRLKNEE